MLSPGSHTFRAYGQTEISERHRHRYEFNREYEETLVAHGLKIVGVSPDNNFVEVVEVEGHPWFVGCQFHPEFKSKPLTSQPLFKAFIQAAYVHRGQKVGSRKLKSEIVKPAENAVGTERSLGLREAPARPEPQTLKASL